LLDKFGGLHFEGGGKSTQVIDVDTSRAMLDLPQYSAVGDAGLLAELQE
jgi:hypothetical protein